MPSYPLILKKIELARALDINARVVTHAVQRGFLIQNEDGLINVRHKVNAHWIAEKEKTGKEFVLDRINSKDLPGRKKGAKAKPKPKTLKSDFTEPEHSTPPQEKTSTPNTPDIAGLEEAKVKAEIKWKESQTRLNELKEQKINGEVIPTEDVAHLFAYAVETLNNLYLQEVRNIAEIYKQRMGMKHTEFVELQKELTIKVNSLVDQFKDELKKGKDGIVDKHSETRGKGERKTEA